MKKLMIILAVLLGLSSLAACGDSKDSAVVKTKAGNITQGDLYKKLKDKYGDQVLQEMVYDKLLKSKYKVSKKAVDKKVNQVKDQFGSEQAFQQALQQNNLTESQFRTNVEQQLMLNKAETDGIKVTDKEMQAYWKKNKDNLIEVKASHILVKDKKTADSIEKKLKDGQKFSDLAKKYSTDTGSKNKGGDLGYFKKGQMVPAFEKKAFSMKVGEISDPVKSQYGYHIIKVTGRKDTYKQLKPEIKKAVLQSKAKSAQDVLQKLVKNNDVKIEDKQFKDLFKQPSSSAPNTSSSSSSK